MTHTTPQPAAELSDANLRAYWRQAGGRFHGPNVETGTMPEAQLLPLLRSLLAASATPQPQALPELPTDERAMFAQWVRSEVGRLFSGGAPEASDFYFAIWSAGRRAALASQPPAPAEAGRVVAWRYRGKGDPWTYVDGPNKPTWPWKTPECEALATQPPSPQPEPANSPAIPDGLPKPIAWVEAEPGARNLGAREIMRGMLCSTRWHYTAERPTVGEGNVLLAIYAAPTQPAQPTDRTEIAVLHAQAFMRGHDAGWAAAVAHTEAAAPAQPVAPQPAVSTPAQPAQQGEAWVCRTCGGSCPKFFCDTHGDRSGEPASFSFPSPDEAVDYAPAVVPAEHPVFAFLDGSGPLEGVWFGEPHPTEQGKFWWRKHLRAAIAPTLSASAGAQSTAAKEPRP